MKLGENTKVCTWIQEISYKIQDIITILITSYLSFLVFFASWGPEIQLISSISFIIE